MKSYLLLFLILISSSGLYGQKSVVSINLDDKKPSYTISDRVSMQISVYASSTDNLLKQFDADPFEKPTIVTERELKNEIASALEKYLSGIGIKFSSESSNQVYLRVEMCALNYLSGKGWTATVKLRLQMNDGSHEVWSQTISGYREEGGGEDEFSFAELAINNAFYDAFESVNWDKMEGSLSKDSYMGETARSEEGNLSVNNPYAAKDQSGYPGNDLPGVKGVYHALVIAIEDYHYMNKLDQPISDATKLIEILASSYSFSRENIIFLKDPTREEIIDRLDMLVKTVKEEDNLLIFYAGHGYWDQKRETGYWLPVDAKLSSTANWLRNSTIQEYIGDIHSKHTLLVADACFGGGIFKTRKAFEDAPQSINQIYELSSRKAITSGMLNEVPDRSVFFEYLIKRLEQNEERYTSALQLFSSFMIAVMNNSDNVPQYGTIQKAGDEGGDFIFIKSR